MLVIKHGMGDHHSDHRKGECANDLATHRFGYELGALDYIGLRAGCQQALVDAVLRKAELAGSFLVGQTAGDRHHALKLALSQAHAKVAFQAKATTRERLARMNADYQRAMAKIQAGWPDYEIKTWTVQADEAKEWTAADADSKPPTPFLTQLWSGRAALGWSEPFAGLVERVIANNDAYTTIVARFTAVRHVAERNIGLDENPLTVTWRFS